MSASPILPNGRVLRYSFHERLVHWLAAVSYIYLMLTGLAFWSPWLFWIAVLFRRGHRFPRTASLGGLDLRGRDSEDVSDVGQADARDGIGQGVLARGSRITFATKTSWFPPPTASTPDRKYCSGDFSGAESCCCSPG